MKMKINIKILSIIILIFLISNAFTIKSQAANRNDYKEIEGTILRASIQTDENLIQKEVEIYNRLPKVVKDMLVENNIFYILIDENIDATDSGHNGTTYFSSYTLKDVWSEGRLNKDIKLNGDIMIHEIGHVLDTFLYDKNNCLMSSTNEWVSLYNANKNIIKDFGGFSKWEVGNSEEAFCEAFAHFINNPQMVKEKTPDVYTFFELLIKDMENEELVFF